MSWWVLRESSKDHVPMRVVARLSEPVVYKGDGLHLDGILAAAAFRELDERTRRRMPPSSSDWQHDVALPLARWIVDVGPDWEGDRRLLRKRGHGGKGSRTTELWGWCASAVQADWLMHGKIEVRKKPELAAMARYADDKTVEIRSGALKAYDLAYPTVFAHELSWYALGDPSAVERLLRTHIVAIGKKHNLGNGTVMSWSVERIDDDRSVVDGDKLMRRMPVGSELEGHRRPGAIRPPYHHISRVVEAVEPC